MTLARQIPGANIDRFFVLHSKTSRFVASVHAPFGVHPAAIRYLLWATTVPAVVAGGGLRKIHQILDNNLTQNGRTEEHALIILFVLQIDSRFNHVFSSKQLVALEIGCIH
jgi:hypothetical protein